jgi:hypothetical protein
MTRFAFAFCGIVCLLLTVSGCGIRYVSFYNHTAEAKTVRIDGKTGQAPPEATWTSESKHFAPTMSFEIVGERAT